MRQSFFLEEGLLIAAISLVERWLTSSWQEYFPDDEPMKVVTVRNQDDLRSTKEALDFDNNQVSPGVSYPYGNMILTNISIATDMGGFSKKNIPFVSRISENRNSVDVSNAIPVRLGLGLAVFSDNLNHIIRQAMILAFAAPTITLLLQSEEGGIIYPVMLNIDPDMAIPQADMGHMAKHFRFDTSLIATTYMIRSRTQGVIRNIILGVADASGQKMDRVFAQYETLDKLIEANIKYTDILDRSSTRYRAT